MRGYSPDEFELFSGLVTHFMTEIFFSYLMCFMFIQELLVKPAAINTEYSYDQCLSYLITESGDVCLEYISIAEETAPFVPKFSYNYQVILKLFIFV